MNLEALDPSILGPALLAGLLVLATHVPLGRQVLARGIIFLDLAVAQIAALGVVIAHTLGWGGGGWQVQLVAMASALAGALLLHACERRWPEVQEALIGTLFVLAASASLLLLSGNPHGGEALKELLTGQILWVSYDQLLPVALLYAGVLLLWFRGCHDGQPLRFYLLFAVAVTASVQLVGLYLVFASLIIPALAVRRLKRGALAWAYVTGGVGYAAGLAASALFDLPSGAMVVWTLALCGVVTALLARRTYAALK